MHLPPGAIDRFHPPTETRILRLRATSAGTLPKPRTSKWRVVITRVSPQTVFWPGFLMSGQSYGSSLYCSERELRPPMPVGCDIFFHHQSECAPLTRTSRVSRRQPKQHEAVALAIKKSSQSGLKLGWHSLSIKNSAHEKDAAEETSA